MNIFITGIGTGVGKTIFSAILCEALQADYWKPVQAGNLDRTDTMRVKQLVSSGKIFFHQEAYRLHLAASPHHAAASENIKINLKKIKPPDTHNHLIIEGAGGLLVPLNRNETIMDWANRWNLPVILVSRHYLGSINHTLLSIEAIRARGLEIIGVVFNGNENPATEQVILRLGKVKPLGRINAEKAITKKVILTYAETFRKKLIRMLD